ncbi:MAG: nitrate ABC transporter substrate-binding protein [Firmicutes bacterium]|nr:nitrate ABC transporter substrate-binding protein [Bacillota bacterium]MBR0113729.1 nitrate ABC transporter substrate-binding protein [Bacillota bacterium]MBR0440953.1 nitrate ABC transporter substrate-binding protein [Bacillota bacterium]
MIHAAQIDMGTDTCIAYMLISGILGLALDKVLLMIESLVLRWKR